MEASLQAILKQATTQKPIRLLGRNLQGSPVYITEEDRESHIHIIGSPGEGKSKFIEGLIRQDIDYGYGACLLDPSDNGDTAYKILKYAISKNYKKIVLIEPRDLSKFGKVATINLIRTDLSAAAVSGNLMDSFRILWGSKDFKDTPRIQRYMPAVFSALHAAKMTMAEARYFMERDKDFEYRRKKIIGSLNQYDINRKHLEGVFESKAAYVFEPFQSTINRLTPFSDPTMEVIFGSRESPLNFDELIKQRYLILVNLDVEGVFGQEHQRLLGTIVVNEIIYAISRLRQDGWNGIYYLYIDEAGDYATSKVQQILDKKRKAGLRLSLSHQGFDQFEDEAIASAIYRGTKIKVLFFTASPDDRMKMIRMLYGGELSDRMVSYNLSLLEKQYAVVKINKQAPEILRVRDMPDTGEVTQEKVDSYKTNLYLNPCYRSTKEVREEIKNRFAITKPGGAFAGRKQKEADDTKGASPRAEDDGQTTGPTEPIRQGRKRFESIFSKKKTERDLGARKLRPDHINAPPDGKGTDG